ncbi:MAG: PAS domain-containing sensor histidine kinase [Rhodoferax sp.]|nr:PAS domain-containing sensor histidine kinase [Rhodoferax sp.]
MEQITPGEFGMPITSGDLDTLNRLKSEIDRLQREKLDLEVLLETLTEHSDGLEEQLFGQLDEAGRNSQERFQLTTETMPLPVLVTTMEDCRVLYANEAAASIFGVSRSYLIAKTVSSFFRANDNADLMNFLTSSKRLRNVEFKGYLIDQRLTWFSVSVQSIDYFSRLCQLSVWFDLTEHKVIQAEKISSLVHLVSGFAHRINTPIGVGLTAASCAFERIVEFQKQIDSTGKIPRDWSGFLEYCNGATSLSMSSLNKANDLVEEFKSIAVDMRDQQKVKFLVQPWLMRLQQNFKEDFEKFGIKILIECPESLTITSYPEIIEQILRKLIRNSIIHGFGNKYNDLHQISLCLKMEHNQLVIDYSDNGKGISVDELHRLFHPFFSIQQTSGIGLGLAAVYNMITMALSGTISVKGDVGEGLAFHIEFSV